MSRAEEKRKRTAELRRLLYVAMTRAEKELFITGKLALGESAHGKNEASGPNDSLPRDTLPQRIKNLVEKKLSAQAKGDEKNGITRITGDAVIDNDTFLGLLLPAVSAQISGWTETETEKGRAPFFKLETIPVYTDNYIKKRERRGAVYPNNPEGLSRFIADIVPYYEKVAILSTPVIPGPYRTPASFRANAGENTSSVSADSADADIRFDAENSGESAADIFGAVDGILARFDAAERAEDGFSAAGFGTIAHAYVESLLNGEEPAVPPKLAGRLAPEEAETLLASGKAIAKRFIKSPLGRKAGAAALRKNEYSFRSVRNLHNDGNSETVFINGTIDLLFEDGDTVYVVDFKTDSRENPAEHIPQMSFYYRAASELRQKPCRLWLYYLRTGRAVEVTGAIAGDINAQEQGLFQKPPLAN
jgi:ATP-dependent helicase/nuclease subunit A